MAVLDDMVERLPTLLQIGRLGAKPAQSGVCVGDRRGERLVDFMGNRGCQLPHRRDAIDVRELHLRLAQGFGRKHMLRQVAGDHERGFNPLRVRPQRRIAYRPVLPAMSGGEPVCEADL